VLTLKACGWGGVGMTRFLSVADECFYSEKIG